MSNIKKASPKNIFKELDVPDSDKKFAKAELALMLAKKIADILNPANEKAISILYYILLDLSEENLNKIKDTL